MLYFICPFQSFIVILVGYHHQYNYSPLQEWGFELPDESISNNATVRYTDFLLAVASGRVEGEKVPGKIATPFERTKVAAYILGAMAPCMRLYSSISNEIQALLGPDDSSHIYRKWIDSYSSQNFEVRHIIICITSRFGSICFEVAGDIYIISTQWSSF